jgi:hypothetical protein
VEYALPAANDPQTALAFGPGLPDAGVAARIVEIAGAQERTAFVAGLAGAAAVPIPRDPQTTAGRLASPGAVYAQMLAAKKNDKFEIRVRARSLGFPLDGVLTVTDAAGKELARADDTDKQPDPQLVFTAPSDGSFALKLRDLHDRGGPRFVYWLDAGPAKPSFSLALTADAFVVAAGKTVEIPITIERRHGHKAPIQFALRAFSGDLPAGISAAEVTADAGAKMAKLVVAAAADAPPGGVAIAIVGSAGANEELASPPNALALAHPPRAAWLTITK